MNGSISQQLATAGKSHGNSIAFARPLAEVELRALEGAPRPQSGTVRWQPPEAYRTWISTVGCFELQWYSPLCELAVTLSLLDASGIEATSSVVYVPQDVSRRDGLALTTNHFEANG